MGAKKVVLEGRCPMERRGARQEFCGVLCVPSRIPLELWELGRERERDE